MSGLLGRESKNGKKVSRKTASRVSSYAGSLKAESISSRPQSSAGSVQPSEDEFDDLASESNWSTAAPGDEALDVDDGNLGDALESLLDSLLDRKSRDKDGRDNNYALYTHVMRLRYSQLEIEDKSQELLECFLRSVRDELSEKMTISALKAVQMTILTDASQAPYDTCLTPLKRSIADSLSRNVKEEALYTLGIAAFFGGASADELEDLISQYLLVIVETDGAHVTAEDDPDVVSAAIDVLGLLATRIQDLADISQDIIAALDEQLDSSYPRVQIAAGEAIAYLYERSYTPLEEFEAREINPASSDDLDTSIPDPSMKKRYDPYRNRDELIAKLRAVAKTSTRSMNKDDRKSLKTNFTYIAQTVENPTLGPRYSTAIDVGTHRPYGNRLFLKVGPKRSNTIPIDRWWRFLRLRSIRRTVQGGLNEHFTLNPAVKGCLAQEQWDGGLDVDEEEEEE